MDKNYLYEKLAEKSKKNLEKEIKEKVRDLDHIDCARITVSPDGLNKIKELCSKKVVCPNWITDILIEDIVETCAEKRIKIDVDNFLKNEE